MNRVLHKEALVAALQDTLLGVQDYEKVKSPGRDNSPLAVNGLNSNFDVQSSFNWGYYDEMTCFLVGFNE